MSKSKSKGGDTLMPSEEAWNLMIRLRDMRAKYKGDEQDLIRARKKLDENLKEMREGTDEYQLACVRYVKVIHGIDKCRAEQKFLADSTDKAIEYAAQGRFFDDDTLKEIERSTHGEDLPLYEKLVEEVGAVDDDEEVGEPAAAAEAKRAKKPPRGQTEAQNFLSPEIEALAKDKDRWSKPLSIAIQDEPLAALNKAGLMTLGNLFWHFRKDGTLEKHGVTREISLALYRLMDDLSDNGLKPPPDGMHVPPAKPEPKRGRGPRPAAA